MIFIISLGLILTACQIPLQKFLNTMPPITKEFAQLVTSSHLTYTHSKTLDDHIVYQGHAPTYATI